MRVSKGDRFVWPDDGPGSVVMVVTRVARDGTWADLLCSVPAVNGVPSATWAKRQQLPLPGSFQRVGPDGTQDRFNRNPR